MRSLIMLAIVGAVVSLALLGCGPSAQTEPGPDPAPAGADGHAEDMEHSAHEHGEHSHPGEAGQADMEKVKAELAKLSPEDAASVEKQRSCPVSDELLGTMGAPIKVDVNGQQVWLCCGGCKESILEDPERYLAKLNQQ